MQTYYEIKYKNKPRRVKHSRLIKRKRALKLFIFVLSFIALGFGAVWLFVHRAVNTPPTPPEYIYEYEPDGYSMDDLTPFTESNDFDGDDNMPIENALRAPEGFTSDDRKELFYTFLIFGEDGSGNTDTIMVASFNATGLEINVIGFPRDLMVNVSRRVKKINAAYPAGRLNGGGRAGGVEQLRREIKTVIGFVPDYYISVDFDLFVKLIDAIGGVEVDVPYDMKYSDPYQNLYIDIKKGEGVLLDGERALHYARYRRGSGGSPTITDYQRIENQQRIIKAAVSKLLQPANLLKLPQLIEMFSENVNTDVKLTEALWFADRFGKFQNTGTLHAYTLPTKGTSGAPMWYEYADADAIPGLINTTVNPYTINIQPRDISIAE